MGLSRTGLALMGLEILHQLLESRLVRVMSLPIAEVRDEVLSDFAGRILAGVCVETAPPADCLVVDDGDGNEDVPIV